MSEKISQYDFSEIVQKRKSIYRIDSKYAVLLALAFIALFVHPFISIPFMVVYSGRALWKIRCAAHSKCPRCGEKFGSTWNIPIGYGGDNCQNCDISLVETGEVDNWPPLS